MRTFKRLVGVLISILILGFGLALIFKAQVGAGPYDAVSQTLSLITNIKIGTITTIINGVFLLIQIITQGKNFPVSQYLQIVIIFALGYVINFFFYDVLAFELESYPVRILFFLAGTVIGAIGISGIVNINIVYTALEGFLIALSEKTNTDFVKNRFYFDIFCVVLTIALAYIFKVDLMIREGTILSAILFSPIMGFFLKTTKPLLEKLDLCEEKVVTE